MSTQSRLKRGCVAFIVLILASSEAMARGGHYHCGRGCNPFGDSSSALVRSPLALWDTWRSDGSTDGADKEFCGPVETNEKSPEGGPRK
ncbi:hypothetical protein [Paraburkholderia sp. SIMBA_054]|uniref:hypothetical protein n=1 Tax=Paraburkholderia TaxID=1822464 RepID=UPI00397DC844